MQYIKDEFNYHREQMLVCVSYIIEMFIQLSYTTYVDVDMIKYMLVMFAVLTIS